MNNLIDMFNESVRINGNRLAIKCSKEEYTFYELKEKSKALSIELQNYLTKEEECIGILLDRSCKYIVSILSILYDGVAYVPMDDIYPIERLKHIVNESNINILITDNNYIDKIRDAFDEVVLVNDYVILFNRTAQNNKKEIKITPNSLAYVIYTSGSTGKPKGVMIEHKSVMNLIYQLKKMMLKKYENNKLNIGVVAPFVFDVSVQQMYLSLLLGHSLFITSNDERKDGRKLIDFINRNSINIIDGTPTHLEMINIALENNQRTIEKKLHFISAAESLHSSTVIKSMNLLKNIEFSITNMYGPTECCVYATVYDIDNKLINENTPIPIGKPIGNVKAYILDSNLNKVGNGMNGELYISGVCVGRGYINNKALTEEVYLKDPFDSNSIMYKTGDLAKYRDDGNIICLGRIDNQVKIKGYRVELGEIESQIKSLDFIDNVCVKLEEINKNKILTAYVVTKKEDLVKDIKVKLQSKLPEYMIPNNYLIISEMPMNQNGKIDKKKLVFNIKNNLALNEDYLEKNVNKTEFKITKLFSRILSRTDININTSFFELGGDSLMSFSLICEISNIFNLEVQLSDIYQYNTVKLLSNYLNTLEVKENAEEKKVYNNMYPTTIIQNLFLNTNDESILGIQVEFIEKLNADRMIIVIKNLIEKQIIFKTKFVKKGTENYQFIDNIVDLKEIIKIANNENLTLKEMIKKTDLINPYKNSPYRFIIFENKFIFITNHIVLDFYSFHVIIKEIIYNYYDMPMHNLKKSYFDYALWEENFLKSEKYKENKRELIEDLSNIKQITTLNKKDEYNIVKRDMESYIFYLEDSKLKSLEIIIHEFNCTKNVFLLAIVQIVLSKLSGNNEIMLWLLSNGRNGMNNYEIVGNFAFPTPFISKIDFSFKIKQYIELLLLKLSNTFKREIIDLSTILNEIHTVNKSIVNEFFNITYNYISLNMGYDKTIQQKIKNIDFEENTMMEYELNFIIIEKENLIQIEIQYDKNIISEELLLKIKYMMLRYLDQNEVEKLNLITIEEF